MEHALASFEVDLAFNSRTFDPEKDLQVAWYDPTAGIHRDFCEHFESEPRSARRLTTEQISNGPFDRKEKWSLVASIAYSPKQINIDTARLDVLEFDHRAGSILEIPVNVQIEVRSRSVRPKPKWKRPARVPTSLAEALKDLLDALSAIVDDHPELLDTDVREALGDIVWNSFLVPDSGYSFPKSFRLDSTKATKHVKNAVTEFIQHAVRLSSETGLHGFSGRLAAFQNPDVVSDNGYVYDDFFGWMDPESYDKDGNPKS